MYSPVYSVDTIFVKKKKKAKLMNKSTECFIIKNLLYFLCINLTVISLYIYVHVAEFVIFVNQMEMQAFVGISEHHSYPELSLSQIYAQKLIEDGDFKDMFI